MPRDGEMTGNHTAMAAAFRRAGIGHKERLYVKGLEALRRGAPVDAGARLLATIRQDADLLAALIGEPALLAAAERLVNEIAKDMRGSAAAVGGAGEEPNASNGDFRGVRPAALQRGDGGGGGEKIARKGEENASPVVAGGRSDAANARKGEKSFAPSSPINPAGGARPATGAGNGRCARKGDVLSARPGQPHKPGRVAGLNTPGAAAAAARMLERQGLSPLDSILINGKRLREVTAHEALVCAERLEGKAKIIKALCAGLPPTGKIGDYIGDAEAQRIVGGMK